MDWIIYSFLMFVFSVVFYLMLRKLQIEKVSNKINTLFLFVPATPMFVIWIILAGKDISIKWEYIILLIIATFFFSYLGNIFSLDGIEKSPNAGYSLIIQKSYSIYTAVAAVFLFDSELTFRGILAIFIIIIFAAMIMIDPKAKNRRKDTFWVIPSILAFFAFGNLVLFSKWLLNEGVDPIVRAFYVSFFVSIMYGIDLFRSRKQVNFKNFLHNRKFLVLGILMGIFCGLFNAFMQLGIDTAPNIGYVNIINTSSITALTLCSVILFKDKLNLQKIIGMIGIISGLAILLI